MSNREKICFVLCSMIRAIMASGSRGTKLNELIGCPIEAHVERATVEMSPQGTTGGRRDVKKRASWINSTKSLEILLLVHAIIRELMTRRKRTASRTIDKTRPPTS